MDFENTQFHYWDLFPKTVKVSLTGWPVTIPLSVRGAPTGQIEFESADSEMAWVDEDGRLNLGWQAGAHAGSPGCPDAEGVGVVERAQAHKEVKRGPEIPLDLSVDRSAHGIPPVSR